MRVGRFREDLYYRVNVVRIELPPLRRRKEDIPLLVETFIERFNRLQGRSVRGIDAETLSLLVDQEWPGNIRQLENAIERAFILCGDGPIGVAHLPEELTSAAGGRRRVPSDIRTARGLLDARAIQEAVVKARGNRAAAARELGIHRTTLFRIVRRLGLVLPGRDRGCGR